MMRKLSAQLSSRLMSNIVQQAFAELTVQV